MAKTTEEAKKVEPKKVQKKIIKKEKKVSTPKKSFFKEVKAELKKVKWPTKEDMLKYSIATLAFVVIFGLYFYGLDALFAWISSLVKGL